MKQLIDQQQLNEFTEHDADMLADLAVIFARAVPDYLARLNLCIAKSNPTEMREVSHQIKSQLNYFFCESLINMAIQLEEMGLQGSTSNAFDIFRRLATGIEQLVDELGQLTGLNLAIAED